MSASARLAALRAALLLTLLRLPRSSAEVADLARTLAAYLLSAGEHGAALAARYLAGLDELPARASAAADAMSLALRQLAERVEPGLVDALAITSDVATAIAAATKAPTLPHLYREAANVVRLLATGQPLYGAAHDAILACARRDPASAEGLVVWADMLASCSAAQLVDMADKLDELGALAVDGPGCDGCGASSDAPCAAACPRRLAREEAFRAAQAPAGAEATMCEPERVTYDPADLELTPVHMWRTTKEDDLATLCADGCPPDEWGSNWRESVTCPACLAALPPQHGPDAADIADGDAALAASDARKLCEEVAVWLDADTDGGIMGAALAGCIRTDVAHGRASEALAELSAATVAYMPEPLRSRVAARRAGSLAASTQHAPPVVTAPAACGCDAFGQPPSFCGDPAHHPDAAQAAADRADPRGLAQAVAEALDRCGWDLTAEMLRDAHVSTRAWEAVTSENGAIHALRRVRPDLAARVERLREPQSVSGADVVAAPDDEPPRGLPVKAGVLTSEGPTLAEQVAAFYEAHGLRSLAAAVRADGVEALRGVERGKLRRKAPDLAERVDVALAAGRPS